MHPRGYSRSALVEFMREVDGKLRNNASALSDIMELIDVRILTGRFINDLDEDGEVIE